MKTDIVHAENVKWGIREVPTAEPLAGRVPVRVRASGIYFTDVWTTQVLLSREGMEIIEKGRASFRCPTGWFFF